MSKTMTSKIEAADRLSQMVTAAVLEAGRTALTAEEIKAVLDRIGEMLESED
jgi:hypothetical protein